MLKCHQWLTLETCIRVFPCRSQFLVAWLKGVHRLITVATFLKRDQINFFLGNNSGHMFASIVKPFDDYRWYQKFFLRPPCLAKSLVKSFGGKKNIIGPKIFEVQKYFWVEKNYQSIFFHDAKRVNKNSLYKNHN